MRLTDWLRTLRHQLPWPPVSEPTPFQVAPNRRPYPGGRISEGFSQRNAPHRPFVPTRRLPIGIRREPPPRPVS